MADAAGTSDMKVGCRGIFLRKLNGHIILEKKNTKNRFDFILFFEDSLFYRLHHMQYRKGSSKEILCGKI